ncbi:MAG: T9SS type A sorting domain-containing protein [Ferruginibacter sp.]
MKKMLICQMSLLFFMASSFAQNYITGPKFNPGVRATSTNGKFVWEMESDGYFVVSEVIAGYGKLLLFQDMFTGKGIPGEPRYAHYRVSDGSLYFGYRQYANEQSWYNYVHSLGYVDITRMTIDDVGNVRIYITQGGNFVLVRTYDNTTPATIARSNYHGNVRVKNNYYFLRPLNDEYKTTYFSAGNIFLLDRANIIQRLKPIVFTAKGYIQLQPGFESTVSGTGSILIKPITSTTASAALRQEEETPALAQDELQDLQVYPNPASDIVNIKTKPGDKVKDISVFDSKGVRVLQLNNAVKFDISRLPPGLYLYKIRTEAQLYSGKLVKN